jgi:hypothetical protein
MHNYLLFRSLLFTNFCLFSVWRLHITLCTVPLLNEWPSRVGQIYGEDLPTNALLTHFLQDDGRAIPQAVSRRRLPMAAAWI